MSILYQLQSLYSLSEDLFIQNKYFKWYFNIIENAKIKNKIKLDKQYFEEHHIIPECFFIENTRKTKDGILKGNPNLKENKILLTSREHFLCHYCLKKFTIGVQKRQMVSSFHFMSVNPNKNSKRYINSRLYKENKKEFAKNISLKLKNTSFSLNHINNIKLNHKGMKGLHHSEIGKQNIRNAIGMGFWYNKEGPNKNKKMPNISKALKNRPKSEQHKKSLSIVNKNMVIAFDLINHKNVFIKKSLFLLNKERYCGITSKRKCQ